MKIAIVNTYSSGSTGLIASSIGEYAKSRGHEVRLYYGREKNNDQYWTYIGKKFNLAVSNIFTYISGNIGSYHIQSTKKLILDLKKYNPDVIHLHNIHGNYLNFKLLFNYLSAFNGKVIITMHDEFLLTGRCALCFCDKWKTGCQKCKFLSAYPHALFDKSKRMQLKKQEMLSKIKNLTIVTPSIWLRNLVKESKLKNLNCVYIHNGIPSIVPEQFDIENLVDRHKINVLFAAYTWSVSKGALVIKELMQKIDTNKFNIIIAGYDKYCEKWFDFDCKKIGLLSRAKMLYLLNNVNVFVNPTFKDNLPSILIESLQMETPVITFNTGGCSEIIDEVCGIVTKENNTNSLYESIINFPKYHFDNVEFSKKQNVFLWKRCVNNIYYYIRLI